MSRFEDTLIDVLASRIRDVVARRGPGHCAQVPHIPAKLAEEVAKRLHDDARSDERFCLVTANPKKPWHAAPAKVVEHRNESETSGLKLVVLIPAGSQLPVEDSFGVTTFEVIDTSTLYQDARAQASLKLTEVDPVFAKTVEVVAREVLRRNDFGVSEKAVARFTSDALSRPNAQGLGKAMSALGLIPDSGLVDEPEEEIPSRLRRNLQQMERLATPEAAADRVRNVFPESDDDESEQDRRSLLGVLEQASPDRWDVARGLADELADAPATRLIEKQAAAASISQLMFLGLKGDLDHDLDPPTTRGGQPKITASIRCTPPPKSISGLSHLRLYVMHRPERSNALIDVGIQKRKAVTSLGRGGDLTWSVKLDVDDLDPGTYVLRVEAVDEDNFVQKEAESEAFVVKEADPGDAPIEADVGGMAEASVRARRAAGGAVGMPHVAYSRPAEGAAGSLAHDFVMRFDGAPGSFRMLVPKPLARVEEMVLSDPRDPINWRLDPDGTIVADETIDGLPSAFLDAREAVARAVSSNQLLVGDDVPICLATADLREVQEAAVAYAEAWRSELEKSDEVTRRALLRLDQVRLDAASELVLVGPFHPLRFLWLVRHHQQLLEAAEVEDVDDGDCERLVRLASSLGPENVPHVIVVGGRELRFFESLSLQWGLWAPPSSSNIAPRVAEIRRRLVGNQRRLGGIAPEEIVRRVRRYLSTHPYVSTLQLNVVQPGDGALILEVLLALQADVRTADVRFVVRLFAADLQRSATGAALDAFMAEPESARAKNKDAADALVSSSGDVLAPKLTYSKHELSTLAEAPERFPAHLSVFVDWFELDAVPVPPLSERRSFFAGGVLIDPVVVFRPGGNGIDPQWDEHVVTPDSDDPFAAAYRGGALATAELLGADAGGTVPAVRLRLGRVKRAVLDAVHRTSDWVLVLDPVFTEEFLDSEKDGKDNPRYLIDAEEREPLHSTRNIVVSTRSRLELTELVRPALEAYGLSASSERVESLLDSMHALNPGLALRLLSAPTHALEAVSLGLAGIHLEAQGILRKALVVPLDLHQDLFREELELGSAGVEALSRTDLALVRPRADARCLEVHLVEVKARKDLPGTLPAAFLDGIAAQLNNSLMVLGSTLFGMSDRPQIELVSAMRTRRLSRLLSRYLDRATRHEHMAAADAARARSLIMSLDKGFDVQFVMHAVVFDLGDTSEDEETTFDRVAVHRVSRARVLRMLDSAPTRLQTIPSARLEVDEPSILESTALAEVREVRRIERPTPHPILVPVAEDDPEVDESETLPPVPPAEGPEPADVALIGQALESEQYGVVGRHAATGRPVAIDVDGTNVISIFGVQGAGKSYTVGNVIEAALMREPALHRLSNPLGVVVFHFSTDQTYLPEFASMVDANATEAQVAELGGMGAAPRPIEDIHLVVPSDLTTERHAEFGGRLPVHPLLLRPDELVVNDWKLLMGVEGGDQMYVKTITTLLKGLRNDLSLKGLRDAIANSRLTASQKNIAETRLDFVAKFVSDSGGVTDLVQPGRLVIVDVRDPFMEKDEALALFMVLLRAFTQGRDSSGKRFNRLVVFDEAHKYMDNPRLTGAIVESIREMRHKGTSVVIASQNPPSVPREVIELSSVVVAHRFMSPQWLDHVKKVNSGFASDVTSPQLAKLAPGEAFVYSSGGDAMFRRPQRVVMRPRLTRHGGGTIRAVGEG